MSIGRSSRLHAPSIECRLLTGAVSLERAFPADRIRTLENPVLPRGQPGKDFRLHGFRPSKAQIGFEAGEAVGRKARALFDVPVDIVHGEGDETEPLRGLCVERLAAFGLYRLEIRGCGKKAAGEPR